MTNDKTDEAKLKKQALAVLKNTFGYDNFRGPQWDIIKNVLQNNDTLAIMATGSGKSLCYQIPSLMLDGVALVISPLISLMQDQVMQLDQNGIETVFLNSTLSPTEYQENTDRIKSGKIKIAYIAPEGLASTRFSVFLAENNIKVSLVAIDEAHCVSSWGHDFRPDYLRIIELKYKFPKVPFIALTATATKQVQDDIVLQLGMQNTSRFVATFNRPNIYFEVAQKTKTPFNQVVDFLRAHKNESGIIYCLSRKDVDNLTEKLQIKGFNAKSYHAGLDKDTRQQNQEDFLRDSVQIIVATIAFGMGINKSNVRFVIHYSISKSLEQYYQEIGRAGRDGLPSTALLLYSPGDIQRIKNFFKDNEDSTNDERLLNAMIDYATTWECRRKVLLRYFGEEYECIANNKNCCDNCTSPVPTKDATIPAQKLMSCIIRTGEKFGPTYVIQVLCGSTDQKIISRGHNKLSTYGIGKNYHRQVWMTLSNILQKLGYIEVYNEYNCLRVTDFGYKILKTRATIALPIDLDALQSRLKEKNIEHLPAPAKGDLKSLEGLDLLLYENLRAWRRETANKLNLPPYTIFNDKTMLDIIEKKPVLVASLYNIYGLGKVKAERWGEDIITIVKSTAAQNKNSTPQLTP